MSWIDKLNNKNILIWGYGREGKSTEKFLNSHLNSFKYEVYEGVYDTNHFSKFDFIIKSPGVKFFDEDARIISQTEIFYAQFSKQIIGITGSKGKSSTSTMMYNVIKKFTDNVILVGNIGFPCLDYYDEINPSTLIVYEISCHQLQRISQSSHIAVLLNLYEEHLDYYTTFENYAKAKKNIIKKQSDKDFYIINDDIELGFIPLSKRISIDDSNNFKLSVNGDIQQYNAAIVYTIATKLLNYDKKIVLLALQEFKGLRHRLELIGEKDGVKYYDDAISTIVESCIQAITSIKDINTIIIGGMDRGINYTKLIEFLNQTNDLNVICEYASGKRVFNELTIKTKYYVQDLKEAVSLAKTITKKNRSCVLSPAAASYDSFKNFEEKGDYFVKCVFEN